MKLVIIDDSESDRYLARRAVRASCGIQMLEYEAAYLALDDFLDPARASKIFGEGEPVVVLLDIHMPRLNGFEFLERLAGSPIAELAVVLMFTSSSLVADQKRANTHDSVKGYVVKPLTPAKVQELANELELGCVAKRQDADATG